jgi:ABC-type Fe3+-hydroxamate transport system substrate-binding protein
MWLRALAGAGSLLVALGCSSGAPHPGGVPSAPPRRVVVLAPAAAEMMDALGVLDRVVGVGEFGPWPPAIENLPRVGGYDAPNVERALELDADAVLTAASIAASPAHARLDALSIHVVALDTSTFDGVFASLDEVGRLFERQERAATVAAEMQGALRAIEERARGLERLRVLVVVGRDPLFVAGPGSHFDEMIRIAGGTNVASDVGAPYQQASLEALLERRPEVIVDTSDNRPEAARGREPASWSRYAFLPAVENDRVYQVDPGRLAIPGLRLPAMTGLMARLIHPETFGEPTIAEMRP